MGLLPGPAATDPYEVMAYYYDIFATAHGVHQTSPSISAFAWLAQPGDTVIDMGSGTGSLALRLAGLGCTVHCYEPSRAMRAVHLAKLAAQPAAAARISLLPLDCCELPTGVDYATCAGILQCLDRTERKRLFADLAAAVRAGGLLALDMVGDGVPQAWDLRTAAEVTLAGAHYRMSTASEIWMSSAMRRRTEYTVTVGGQIVQRDTVSRILHSVSRPVVCAELAEAGFAVLTMPPVDGLPADFLVARRSPDRREAGGPDA